MQLKPLTEIEFDEIVFESEKPVVVMCGAERCNVCKELLPVVETLNDKYGDELDFYWVDIDVYKNISKKMRIKGIPTLAYFKEGVLEKKIGGLQDRDTLIDFIEK